MNGLQSPLYKNPEAPLAARVEDLLMRMTLPEKLGQMMQLPAVDENAEEYIEKYHVGSYLHALDGDITRLKQLNTERSRLGIPLIFGIDAIHGHCFEDGSTVFPVQLALACSWDTALLTEVGKITAKEAYGAGIDWTFSPVLCMARDPRWGRTSETFGEDSMLIGELAAAMVDGYQNAGVPFAACAKHYAAYGETLGARDCGDAHVSERNMRNIFLPPFEKVAALGCKTMMAAYQSLNGVPCSANTWLMNTVLRDEWRYEGVVVTDWNNCGQVHTVQGAAQSMKDAVELCLAASNDIFMTTPTFFECAQQLIAEGAISETRIDESVRRVLALKFSLGLFDDSEPRSKQQQWRDDRWDVSLQASRQSLTLVKNGGILPLRAKGRQKILLVGDNADNVLSQLGDWSFIPGMHAYSDSITHRSSVVTLRQALEADENISLTFMGSEVCGPLTDTQADKVGLLAAAQSADLVIFCGGDALKQHGEFHDRAELDLPGNQNPVFDVLAGSGVPLISVLIMSKPHAINSVMEHSDAVLIAFNPGAKAGCAIRECLFGEFNPSGRLPMSFPRSVGQLPVYYNQAPGWHAYQSPHYDGQNHYIDCDATPLLAFGEGMSYSEIVYGEVQLDQSEVRSNESARLTVQLGNNSDRSAVEVVQLYAQWRIKGVTSPAKNLIQYQRVELEAGEQQAVTFLIEADAIRVRDLDLNLVHYQGELVLYVGHSSKHDDLQVATLQIVP